MKKCEYCGAPLENEFGNSAYLLVEGKTLRVCDYCNDLEILKRLEKDML